MDWSDPARCYRTMLLETYPGLAVGDLTAAAEKNAYANDRGEVWLHDVEDAMRILENARGRFSPVDTAARGAEESAS